MVKTHKTDVLMIVPLHGDWPFYWLGDCSVLEMLLRKLEDIREINRIAIMYPKAKTNDYITQVGDCLAIMDEAPYEQYEYINQPQTWPDYYRVWQGQAKTTAQRHIVCNPAFPFLDQDKIAQMVYALVSDTKTVVAAVPGQVVGEHGKSVGDGYLIPAACMGMQHEIWKLLNAGNHELLLDPRHRKIFKLDFMETVDVRTPKGREMAQNLSACGLT